MASPTAGAPARPFCVCWDWTTATLLPPSCTTMTGFLTMTIGGTGGSISAGDESLTSPPHKAWVILMCHVRVAIPIIHGVTI